MMGAKDIDRAPHRHLGGLSARQFVGMVCLFWLYVVLSNVLYAYSMRTGLARVTNAPLYAAWDARVMQHVLLLPLLLISYWASLRVQWRPLWLALPLQAILAFAFAALAYPAMLLAQLIIDGPERYEHGVSHASSAWMDPYFLSLWLASLVNFLPAYGFGLALITGAALYTRFRDSELQRAALEREWSAARLAALRMQLSPHTLFNLLHTIRGNIEWDPKGAQSMVVQLGDLLRRLLSAGEREFSRLADELQFVKLYLDLQQRRFTDRLCIALPQADEVPAVWTPSLILQPLVENAVAHGLAGHQGAVTVRLTARVSSGVLKLRVVNTVAQDRPVHQEGIGLRNVRERLAVQFGDRAELSAGVVDGEWVSEISMPEILEMPNGRQANGRHQPQARARA
jgi:hypothetical protein